MKCRKVIRQLPAYLDDELTVAEAKELEGHLELCVFCSTELASLRQASKMLDAWEDVSPRRCHADAVITQIQVEEHGVVEGSRAGVETLKGRWTVGAVRAAAAAVFVLGAFVFSGHMPVKGPAEDAATVARLKAAKELMLLDEDASIKPSELGLAWRGMENRQRLIRAALSDPRERGSRANGAFPVGDGFPTFEHLYFPGEEMPVESVIPVSGDGR